MNKQTERKVFYHLTADGNVHETTEELPIDIKYDWIKLPPNGLIAINLPSMRLVDHCLHIFRLGVLERQLKKL